MPVTAIININQEDIIVPEKARPGLPSHKNESKPNSTVKLLIIPVVKISHYFRTYF